MVEQTIKTSDRRVYDRFLARYPAKFKDTREDFGDNVFLRDASAEGIRITSRERLFLHDSVSLEIKLPDGKTPNPVVLKGDVVWVKSRDPNLWDVGLRFHKISFFSMSRLYNLAVPD